MPRIILLQETISGLVSSKFNIVYAELEYRRRDRDCSRESDHVAFTHVRSSCDERGREIPALTHDLFSCASIYVFTHLWRNIRARLSH